MLYVYFLKLKNCVIINNEFNKLYDWYKLKWMNELTEYTFSVFII